MSRFPGSCMQSRGVGPYWNLRFCGGLLQQSVGHRASHNVSEADEYEKGSVCGNKALVDCVHSDYLEHAHARVNSAGARAKANKNAPFLEYALGNHFLQGRFEKRGDLSGYAHGIDRRFSHISARGLPVLRGHNWEKRWNGRIG